MPPANEWVKSLGLHDNPVVTGLWQVADLERGGKTLDKDRASDALLDYVADGFRCFDMADHYGSAELIAGAARAKLLRSSPQRAANLKLYTKWCPAPDQCTFNQVRDGIAQRMERLGVDSIDLLQLHWWSFDHPGYIDVMDSLSRLQQEGWIKQIGLTNFDTDHLHVLLASGYKIATNQVCVSVLDRRALGDMSELCMRSGVRLLAYGTLAGGFLTDRWLNQPEPATVDDWSKMKYQRFIRAVGGWSVYQHLLQTLDVIAKRHNLSIANVAARWVLQQEAVAGVIVGARLTEHAHRSSNQDLQSARLEQDDLQRINATHTKLTRIPGDCGSEYRRPPFLTASGDLSHHLNSLPKVYVMQAVPGKKNRWRIDSGSEFEPIAGYSRAVRIGNRVLISGTTATHALDRPVCSHDPKAQAVYILDKISACLNALGACLDDVIRTRIYLKDGNDWEAVSRVHGRFFCDCLPANTLIEVGDLIGDYSVEIEAEAIIDDA